MHAPSVPCGDTWKLLLPSRVRRIAWLAQIRLPQRTPDGIFDGSLELRARYIAGTRPLLVQEACRPLFNNFRQSIQCILHLRQACGQLGVGGNTCGSVACGRSNQLG